MTEITRDRWGRPYITPPGGGKQIAYTRCTTFIDGVEDNYNLVQWAKRQVAIGLSQRPDLQALVAGYATDPEAHKNELTQIAETAMEAAGSSKAANLGTALHAMTERLDRGLELGVIPTELQPHIAAYQQITAPLTALACEQFLVNDELQVGGTADRILQIDGLPGLFIGDIKTGNLYFNKDGGLSYGGLKFAMQLAIYSRSVLYDPDTGARTPIEGLRTDVGIVIALNSRTAETRLLQVDLNEGWEAVQVAKQIRQWRKRGKTVAAPWQTPTTADARQQLTDEVIRQAIATATTVEELARVWQTAGTAWVDDHTRLAAERKQALEAALLAPLGATQIPAL